MCRVGAHELVNNTAACKQEVQRSDCFYGLPLLQELQMGQFHRISCRLLLLLAVSAPPSSSGSLTPVPPHISIFGGSEFKPRLVFQISTAVVHTCTQPNSDTPPHKSEMSVCNPTAPLYRLNNVMWVSTQRSFSWFLYFIFIRFAAKKKSALT